MFAGSLLRNRPAGAGRGCAVLLLLIGLGACESSTDVEPPKLRDGSSAELALEIPPLYPPPPRRAILPTDYDVILSGRIWFRNIENEPLWVNVWIEDPKTGSSVRVGRAEVKAFETRTVTLDPSYATTEYREHAWTLLIQDRTSTNEVVLGYD